MNLRFKPSYFIPRMMTLFSRSPLNLIQLQMVLNTESLSLKVLWFSSSFMIRDSDPIPSASSLEKKSYSQSSLGLTEAKTIARSVQGAYGVICSISS